MAIIHFYQANYVRKKTKISNGKNLIERTELSYEELKNDIKSIIKLNSKNNTIILDDAPDWVAMEILEMGKNINVKVNNANINECSYIFARLGRKKDINNIQKRNMKDYSTKKIEIDVDEDMEIYTYFYIFFEDSVKKVSIAYLTSKSAPHISKISNLIYKYHHDKSNVIEVNPILTEESTQILQHKKIINAIQYKIAVPTKKIIGLDGIGLPENIYEELENVKSTDIVITITAERNQNLLKDKTKIEELKDHIYKTHASNVKECLAKAKDNPKDKILPYHFLENEFISKVNFKYSTKNIEERYNEIRDKLHTEYINNRKDLLDYMK
jgi:hypothetical protein